MQAYIPHFQIPCNCLSETDKLIIRGSSLVSELFLLAKEPFTDTKNILKKKSVAMGIPIHNAVDPEAGMPKSLPAIKVSVMIVPARLIILNSLSFLLKIIEKVAINDNAAKSSTIKIQMGSVPLVKIKASSDKIKTTEKKY